MKRSTKKIKTRVKVIVISLLILTGLMGFYFLLKLPSFNELERATTRRALRKPVRFYANLRVLRPGDPISMKQVIHLLKQRGYEAQTTEPDDVKQYCQKTGNHLQVFMDLFSYPDGVVTGGLHHLIFDKDRLKSILRLAQKIPVNEMRLEALPLDDFSTGSAESSLWVPLEKVPLILRKGVVVSEDRRFYEHHGVDWFGILRAFRINVRKKGYYQGGSTLTQQLIKNVFLTPEKTLRRKAREILMAFMCEWRFEKDFILEMYLNQIYLGQNGPRGLYGVQEASQAYFGKPVSALSLEECALLIGLIPAPNAYHPRSSPDKALRRRNIVLDVMWKNGLIPAHEFQSALRQPIELAPLSVDSVGFYYVSWVRQLLEEEFSRFELDSSGFKVYLALDTDIQRASEKVLRKQNLEGAVVAMDPQTGFVKALVGGRHYASSPFNRAVLAYRQPGSAFKPILYAAALESHAVTLSTLLEDNPFELTVGETVWAPQNFDGMFRGSVTVRDALVHSYNVPSIHLLEHVGIDQVVSLAEELGVQSPLLPVPSLALGTSEVTPFELTRAYCAFANGGNAVTPVFINWIVDDKGRMRFHQVPQKTRVLSRETAFLVTDVLKDVIERGTGRNVRRLGYQGPAAGKTGTSDDFSDAWFVGYTTQLVCGVWLGHDIPLTLGKSSSRLALPVWVELMKSLGHHMSFQDFSQDINMLKAEIDPETGQRANNGCPLKRIEYFNPQSTLPVFCEKHAKKREGFFKKIFKFFQ